MAEFIPINGKLITYGLTWVTVTSQKNSATECIALFRSQQAQYQVNYSGKTRKIGVAKKVIESVGAQPKGALLSAALLFSEYIARHSPSENSLLIHPINDHKVAIIALLQSSPYLDVVIDAADLDGQLASLYQEGHATFAVYGTMPAYTQKPLPVEDLLLVDTAPAVLVRVRDPVRWMQNIGAATLAILIIGSVVTWKIHKVNKNLEDAAKKINDPVQTYQENTRQLLANAKFNGRAAYTAIWSTIKKRDIEVAGWSLKQLQCKPEQCTETWKQGHGTLIQLTQHVQKPYTIQLQSDGETAAIYYPVFGSRSAINQNTLPKKDVLWPKLVAQQQSFKRLLPSLLFAPKPAKPDGLTPITMASSIPSNLLVYRGEMTVSAPLGLAGEILEYYLSDIMITEISLANFDDLHNATIQIKGNYYAQN